MVEAVITKATIIHDDKMRPTLLGVAEHDGDAVNFKVKNYEFEMLDKDGFLSDLREQLAEDFDIPAYRVDVRGDWLLAKMQAMDPHASQGILG